MSRFVAIAITTGPGWAEVRFDGFSHEARHIIESAPTRRFDRKAKCWRIPLDDVALVARMYRDRGYRVTTPQAAGA